MAANESHPREQEVTAEVGRDPRVLVIPSYTLGYAGSFYMFQLSTTFGSENANAANATSERFALATRRTFSCVCRRYDVCFFDFSWHTVYFSDREETENHLQHPIIHVDYLMARSAFAWSRIASRTGVSNKCPWHIKFVPQASSGQSVPAMKNFPAACVGIDVQIVISARIDCSRTKHSNGDVSWHRLNIFF